MHLSRFPLTHILDGVLLSLPVEGGKRKMGSAWRAGLFQLRSHLLSNANDSVGLSIDRLRSLTGFRGTRSNGHALYGRAPSVRGPFFRPQVDERALIAVYKRVGKSVISFCKKAQRG